MKKQDEKLLKIKLEEMKELILDYADSKEPSDEKVRACNKKSREINDIFRKYKLLK